MRFSLLRLEPFLRRDSLCFLIVRFDSASFYAIFFILRPLFLLVCSLFLLGFPFQIGSMEYLPLIHRRQQPEPMNREPHHRERHDQSVNEIDEQDEAIGQFGSRKRRQHTFIRSEAIQGKIQIIAGKVPRS